MEQKTIQDILGVTTTRPGNNTLYSLENREAKRQLVVSALLEIFKADALGGGSNVYNNIEYLDQMTDTVLRVLEKKENTD